MTGMPSIRQLRAFVAIYQSGHISAAAELLSITQPAASVLLRELEERLGVKLFDRTTRTLRRTDAAIEAFAYAQRALAEIEALGRSMNDVSQSRHGRIRIAITTTTAQTLLPDLLERFLFQHPGIKVTLDDCSPDEFAERIADERVDFGVGTLNYPIPGFQEDVFLRDRMAAVSKPKWLPPGNAITWKELSGRPIIIVKPGYGVRRNIDRATVQTGIELQIEHEVSLLTTALALASGGLGVALIPQGIVKYSAAKDLVVRTLTEPQIQRDTAIIYRADRLLKPAAEAFRAMALKMNQS